MNTTETIICSTTILAPPSVWGYFWYNFLISQWSAEIIDKGVENMKLGEIQKIYFLLHAIQFNHDEHIDFDLIVDYNGKLITADFLTFYNNRKTSVSEKVFNRDMDVENKRLETNYFDEILGNWRRNYEPFGFNPSKAFSDPGIFLNHITNASTEMKQAPNITNRVYNLKYLESGLSFKEAFLKDDNYSVVALVPK